MRKTHIFTVLLLFLFNYIKAEYNCIFEHLSTEDGLSHGSVSAMLKDSRGFMWFATWDGINRFDGHNFRTFKPGNNNGSNKASNRIETIKEDSLGNIWIINYDSKAFRLNRFSEAIDPIPGQTIFPLTDVSSIFPASSGDVWLTTNEAGVFRVLSDSLTNRHTIFHYHSKSEPALPGNNVGFVAEDPLKRIWINTNLGVTCFEYNQSDKKLKQHNFPNTVEEELSKHSLSYFYATSLQLYFGTNDGSVLIFQMGTDQIQKIEFGNSSPITNIISDLQGTLFFSTNGNGIFVYGENKKEITNHFYNSNIENVLNTYADSHGLLWIESEKPGITKIDLKNDSYKHYEQTLGVNLDLRATAQCGMMEDENQTLWLTLKGGGFGYYNRETDAIEYFFNNPADPLSKVSNFVNCFYKDPSGVLWLSTYFKGIEKITFIDKKFQFIQPAPQSKLSIANEVRALLEDSKGYLWVATKNEELFLLDRNFNIIKEINELNGEKTGRIYALLEDSKGNIYLGSKGKGLFKLTPKGNFNFDVIHFTHQPGNPYSISDNNIYTLIEDKAGRIYIGTYGGGLNLLIDNRFYHAKNEIKNYPIDKGAKVRHIAQDGDGNIWIGTTDGIIIQNRNNQHPSTFSFSIFNKENENARGLQGNDIFWVFCDQQNNIWVSSLGGGLAKLENYSQNDQTLEFTVFSKADGLPSDMIFTITNDKDGSLWMSTENGIAYYNPGKKEFGNYSRYDGILNPGFSEAAIATRPDGRICFGSNKGLYSFYPHQLSTKQKKIGIVLTSFQLFGKEVIPGAQSAIKESISEASSIQLKYNQNMFSLSWAGLDFKLQHKMQFIYKLEGYDDDWRYTQEINQAVYTKIPPGKYTFMVNYSNPDFQMFNNPKSISIVIDPPFWKTNWAFLIYTVLIIGLIELTRRIVTSMIRLRNKVVIEKELTNIKLNFFTNISHELRTPLTLILDPVKEVKKHETLSEKGVVYANLIEVNAMRLLRLVNQLLDFRKVQSNKMELSVNNIDIVPFVQNVCQNFEELSKAKEINFQVSFEIDSLFSSIDEEKMESVLFNILSNAFKFTPKNGTVCVAISQIVNEQKIQLKISDSGIGIPQDQEESLFKVFSSHLNNSGTKQFGTGIGLALSKELVELHQGTLTYAATPGGGATFIIRLNSSNIQLHTGQSLTNDTKNTISPFEIDQSPLASAKQKNKQPRILIVEDNPELRNYLRLQLENEYYIEEAENGLIGLEKAINIQPDIILSDVMMPEMDGIQLLEHIKNNFETSHIPMVLLTARSSVQSKIEGLKYGADAYMTKPFSSEQLKAQLENLLHQRVLLRERFARHDEGIESKTAVLLTEKDAAFLNQVREIIENNLSNTSFKMEDLYSGLNMGRSKFFDKLKGLTGLSPIDFVKEYRLNKAQSLLKTGNYNVTETSYLSGFTDAGYFSKCYKERFGKSPSQVKK